ncbi:MAG: HAD family hydrolase [Prevotellaceae bacterium]|jgi:putative hydrolase of the HAD superfamily|nr:HAD family hydrolase [Prevotellaceae bacterium]
MNKLSDRIHIKAILLDYGGTIDTNGVHWSEVIYDGYKASGAEVPKNIFRNAYVHAEQYMEQNPTMIKPEDTFKETLIKKIKLQADFYSQENIPYNISQHVDSIVDYCYKTAKGTVADAEKTLAILKKKYPLVLVSNFYGNLQSVIKDFGIHQYFTTIVESAIIGVRKPNPEIFRIALQDLSISASEAIIVGDSYKNDMVPAQQLGCIAVWLKGIGWERESEQNNNVTDVKYSIRNFNDLAELIDIIEK